MNDCGHKIIKYCHEENPKCTFKCIDRLKCGHACELNCHKDNDPEHEQVNNSLSTLLTFLKSLISLFVTYIVFETAVQMQETMYENE